MNKSNRGLKTAKVTLEVTQDHLILVPFDRTRVISY